MATPWTVAHKAPLSMGFSGQEHWSGLPFPFPGDQPRDRQEDSFVSEPPGNPKFWKESFLIGLIWFGFLFIFAGKSIGKIRGWGKGKEMTLSVSA